MIKSVCDDSGAGMKDIACDQIEVVLKEGDTPSSRKTKALDLLEEGGEDEDAFKLDPRLL